MSIKKQNTKRPMLTVLALAMSVAVLAAGTAYAAEEPPVLTTVTNQASSSWVAAGAPVTFHMTVTNNEPYDLGPVSAMAVFRPEASSPSVEIVSASSSQGQCSFAPSAGKEARVLCDLGTLPAGATAEIDFVVVPQESGLMINTASSYRPPVGGEPAAIFSPKASASVWVY